MPKHLQSGAIADLVENQDSIVNEMEWLGSLFHAVTEKAEKIYEQAPPDGTRAGLNQIKDLARLGHYLTLTFGNDHDVTQTECADILREHLSPIDDSDGGTSHDPAH